MNLICFYCFFIWEIHLEKRRIIRIKSFNEFRINFEEILHMYMMNKILNANHNQCNEKAIKNCLYKLV